MTTPLSPMLAALRRIRSQGTPVVEHEACGAFLSLIRRARRERGLPSVHANARLAEAAAMHARHMATVGVLGFSHLGDGDTADRVEAAGYAWTGLGEFIAQQRGRPDEVVLAWLNLYRSAKQRLMRSRGLTGALRAWADGPGRTPLLLTEFTQIGAAAASSRHGLYWSCIVATPFPEAAIQRESGTRVGRLAG